MTCQNKSFVVKRHAKLKLKGCTNVGNFIGFKDIVNQLSTLELTLSEELQALLLLSSLPNSWETLLVTVSHSTPGGKLCLSTFKDCFFNEQACRKKIGADIDQSLIT